MLLLHLRGLRRVLLLQAAAAFLLVVVVLILTMLGLRGHHSGEGLMLRRGRWVMVMVMLLQLGSEASIQTGL